MMICHEAYEPLSTAEVMELAALEYHVLVLNKRCPKVVCVNNMYVHDYLDYIAHPKYYAAWLEEPVCIESSEEIERKKKERKE